MASITSMIPASTASTTPNFGVSTQTTKPDDKKNQFLQLLVAQLKGQNPLDPLDGTQFVSQLAQFSSLEELTGMHSALNNIQNLMQNPVAPQASSNPSQLFH